MGLDSNSAGKFPTWRGRIWGFRLHGGIAMVTTRSFFLIYRIQCDFGSRITDGWSTVLISCLYAQCIESSVD